MRTKNRIYVFATRIPKRKNLLVFGLSRFRTYSSKIQKIGKIIEFHMGNYRTVLIQGWTATFYRGHLLLLPLSFLSRRILMNSKVIPHNYKDGIHLIPIAVHPPVVTNKLKFGTAVQSFSFLIETVYWLNIAISLIFVDSVQTVEKMLTFFSNLNLYPYTCCSEADFSIIR